MLAYHGKQKFDSVEAVDVKCYAQASALHSAQDDALREASHRITVRVRTIPSGVTSIGDSAFSGCSNLSNIYFGGTEAQWNAISAEASIPQSATVTYNYTA